MSRKKYNIDSRQLFGERIRAVRKKKGLTQPDMAEKLGLKPGYISQMEAGQRMPGTEILTSLMKDLHVNINWLITGIGEMFEISYDTETVVVQENPNTANNADTTQLLNAVREIFTSENESIKTTLKTMILAFHGTIMNNAKIEDLKGEARARDKHIADLEKKVETLMKIVNTVVPNTEAKKS
jgi:transcriptional regulator with XRE-family HTH domain